METLKVRILVMLLILLTSTLTKHKSKLNSVSSINVKQSYLNKVLIEHSD